ncbi:transketolase family protein [Spirosoma montaniterrae]|uniref:Transketolase-like pyrimidine-binding domain-containing protein n=1 Tax=Spirosoma montaniterrae TaxID=1178516 RepID=A0A1P9WRH9_9BACT|nr:transketolase C-terminal domain-containing protein [Spirosoma montaniterrae]AQG77977.1 hypothetical protein AWR27_00590 [Spirosoma montaniterrae]
MAENNDNESGDASLRDAFGHTLLELGHRHDNLIFLDADLHTSTKATGFKKRFPDRFVQVGIAEQNLFGMAAGLALEGFTSMPSTFAAFAARRALDQLAISICFPKLNVKIPGSYCGIPTSRAGASHNCIEDLAVMRSLPNLLVADPGSNADLRAVMHTAMNTPGPVYFRVTRYAVPELFGPDHEFVWGRGETLREGADVTLFGTGIMTWFCLDAADQLAREGIDAEVIHLASVKPIDRTLIVQSLSKTGCAVTAENASIYGGLGDAVSEVLTDEWPAPVQRIGVRDKFVESGGIDELFARHLMTPTDIAKAARLALSRKVRREVLI